MKSSVVLLAVGYACALSVLSLSSCATDPYAYDPEGTSYSTLPPGYTAIMIAGISYWYHDNHYCRYWPGHGYVVVRPPHGRPPYHRPPNRPPGNRPGGPGHKPVPGYPGYKPGNPGRPGINPPATKPSVPVRRPSQPSIQPVPNPGWGGGSPGRSPGGFSRGGRGGGGGGRGMRGR